MLETPEKRWDKKNEMIKASLPGIINVLKKKKKYKKEEVISP